MWSCSPGPFVTACVVPVGLMPLVGQVFSEAETHAGKNQDTPHANQRRSGLNCRTQSIAD